MTSINLVAPLNTLPVAKTIDLNQAAASYNLFTGAGKPVLLQSLAVRLSGGSIGTTGALANGTAIVTEAGTPLAIGANTIHITGAGTFTITLPAGVTAIVASGTATIAGSPKACAAGVATVCDSGATIGTATVTLTQVLTGISIQTDDSTPQVIIPSTLGAVVNLANEAQLSWNAGEAGPIYINVARHIQLTIIGGAAGVARVCDVVAEYRSVLAGGTLS